MSIKECIAIITATAETFSHFFLNFLLSSTSSTSQLCVVTLMSAQAVTAPNYSVHSVTLRPKFWALVPKSPKWDMIIWNEVHLTPSSLPQRPSFPSALLDSYKKKSFFPIFIIQKSIPFLNGCSIDDVNGYISFTKIRTWSLNLGSFCCVFCES